MNAKKITCFVLGYLAFLNQKFRMRTRVVPVLFFGVGIGILSAGFSYVTAEANVPSSIVSKAIAVTSPVNLAINADSKSRTRVEVLDGSRWVTVNWRAEGFERGDTCLVNIAFAPTSVGSLDSSQVFQNISYLSTLLGSTVGTSWVKVSKNIVPQSVTIYPRISCVHQGLTYSANKAVCVDCNSTWKEEPAVLTVASKTFKNVLYGQSGYEEIYIKYSGNLKADNVVVRGLTEAGSGITNEGGSNMPCGSSISTDCVIRVKFTPELVAKSALSNSNNVVSDPRYVTIDYFNGKQNISVPFLVTTISTPKATLGVSSSSLDFGVVNQKTRVSKILKLSNQVKGSQLTAVTIPDSINSPFSISENCPDTMSADNSCDVSVAFEPTSEQKYVNSLSVSASDGVTTQTQSVQLQGELQYPKNPAVLSVDTVTMSAKSFKDTVTKSVLIKYSGAENATIDSVTGLGNGVSFVGGTFPGTGGTCQKIISADCTIVLNYSFLNSQNSSALVKPGGSSPVSFVIVMNYANGVSSDVKSTSFLVNTSVIEPRGLLATSLSDINFGQISGSASKIITVSSSVPGSRLSKIKVSPLENPFSVSQGSDCRDDVTNSQRCTLYVMYNPEANTTSSASFAITTSDGVSLQSKTINVIGSAKGLMNSRGQQIGATPGSVVSTDVAKVSIPHEPPAIIIEGSTGTSESFIGDNGMYVNNITLADITDLGVIEKKKIVLNVKFKGSLPVHVTKVDDPGPRDGIRWFGGSYEKNGGTCGVMISADCTIILELYPEIKRSDWSPNPNHLNQNEKLYGYNGYIGFYYNVGNSDTKHFSGADIKIFAPAIAQIEEINKYNKTLDFYSIQSGSEGVVSFLVNTGSGGRGYIKSITLDGLEEPFTHTGTDCNEPVGNEVKSCRIRLTYRPAIITTAGVKKLDQMVLKVDVSNGFSVESAFYPVRGEVQSKMTMNLKEDVLIVYNTKGLSDPGTGTRSSEDIKDYYINHRPGMKEVPQDHILGVEFPDPCIAPTKTGDASKDNDVDVVYAQVCMNPSLHDFQTADRDIYYKNIRGPIISTLKKFPKIRYIIMMPQLPTRMTKSKEDLMKYLKDSNNPNCTYTVGRLGIDGVLVGTGILGCTKMYRADSVSDDLSNLGINDGEKYPKAQSLTNGYFDPAVYPGTSALVTYINMVDSAATIAYIDKLERKYNAMPDDKKSFIISASSGDKQYENGKYYFDMYAINGRSESGLNGIKMTSSYGVPASRVVMNPANTQWPIGGKDAGGVFHPAEDVLGYTSPGTHNGVFSEDAMVKQIKFSGKSDWFLIGTAESFNGATSESQGQTLFKSWFNSDAFGGTNYSNTPAGAVAHIMEPSLLTVDENFFACWDKGELPFIECSWKGLLVGSKAYVFIGDPFITR